MALNTILALVVGACVALALWALRIFGVGGRETEFPRELVRGRLVLAETAIACARPVPLHGTPDEVWQAPNGALIPVETKTRDRARVHRSDVVQLSVYRVILLRGRDPRVRALQVKSHGYVRIVHGPHTTWRRVELLSEEQVVELWHRYRAVTGGLAAPRGTRHPGLCGACGHADWCPVCPPRNPSRRQRKVMDHRRAIG